MGHAEHFLRRLDRVSDAHVERALTLYRDEALLAEVLARARLSPGIERIAISLEDPIEGPFVIVTRSGRFVTCLGKGMRVDASSEVTVLSRERLDAAASKVERMRERLAQVARLSEEGGEGIAARAFRRMGEDGLRFCREDAAALSSVMPLVAEQVSDALLEAAGWISKARERVAYLRFDKLRPHEEEEALGFGRAAWALSHYVVLAEHDDVVAQLAHARAEFESLGHPGIDPRFACLTVAFDLGTFCHATRVAWALARRPRLALAELKAFDRDRSIQMRMMREVGLGAIALGPTKYRAEAEKALSRSRTGADAFAPGSMDGYAGTLGDVVRAIVHDPTEASAASLEYRREVAARFRFRTHDPDEAQVAEIPDDVARAITTVLAASWLEKAQLGAERQVVVLQALPFVARAAALDLFLPRAHAETLFETSVGDVARMVQPYARTGGLARPAPVARGAPKVGRNDPCACGSGKKHKRCCGAAA